jgi:hypothetical protein
MAAVHTLQWGAMPKATIRAVLPGKLRSVGAPLVALDGRWVLFVRAVRLPRHRGVAWRPSRLRATAPAGCAA